MGLLDQFINAMIGGFGLRTFSRPFSRKHNAEFVPALEACQISVICQFPPPSKRTFTGGAIQGGQDTDGSVMTHVIGCTGQKGGELVRRVNPDLVRRSNGLIPEKPLPLEFVEATWPLVRVGTMSEYLNDDIQAVAYLFNDLTETELVRILTYAYSKVGTHYDISEIFSDAFPLLGLAHPEGNHVCSSLWATAFAMAGRLIIPPNARPTDAAPGQINAALYPRNELSIARWNCA